jgi:hypothetical protein
MKLAQVQQPFPSFEDWSHYFPCMTPGWHVIKTCYQVDFDVKKEKYMQQITANNRDSDEWLSCDHTFASAGMYVCTTAFPNKSLASGSLLHYSYTSEFCAMVTSKAACLLQNTRQ